MVWNAMVSAAKGVSQTLAASMAGMFEVSDARERPLRLLRRYGGTGMSLLTVQPALLVKANAWYWNK
jgi:hypothetical protein